jgi:hypothetical protein
MFPRKVLGIKEIVETFLARKKPKKVSFEHFFKLNQILLGPEFIFWKFFGFFISLPK